MFSNVLIVCVGNICRSPTAAFLLRKKLAQKGRDVQVDSAGLSALVGSLAEKTAAHMAAQIDVDLTPHKAQQLTTEMVHHYDLILVMEQLHIQAIENMAPASRGKVHLLGRWHNNIEIPDPYKQGDAAFEHALSLIRLTVNDWAEKL